MNIKVPAEELSEYMFEYHLDNDLGAAEKFYVAHTTREALRAFKHTCRKNHLHAHGLKISRWNRWRGEWEKLKDFSSSLRPELN
ncbi:MAG: hypothetical protein CMI31_06080 [Opitutae bacterium]|nr:hypothetical protein [Opitutae bacterium]|tara:strand:- start:34 stop:285 length:252 start_codon:yes stop_codon:yes gene_type:complete